MKKGFTLIEIIIVIVILGILATMALPRIASRMEIGKAAEAMVFMGILKNQSFNCFEATQDMTRCDSEAELAVAAPTSPKFNYTLTNNGVDEFRIMAVSTAHPANCLKMSVIGSTSQVGMTAYGDLTAMLNMNMPPANGVGVDCTAY